MKQLKVGEGTRWTSRIGGGALMLWGLRRASLVGLAVAAAGAALAWRGLGRRGQRDRSIDHADSGQTVGNLGVKIDRSVVVAMSPERLYRFWRNFANLPRIMTHLDRVETLSETRSRWHARAPAGVPIAWEAEIINDQPPGLIAWRSAPGSVVAHAGSVHFVPEDAGTRVDVSLQYDPPGGALTHAVAALMDADAGARIGHDLVEFKRALESGRLAA